MNIRLDSSNSCVHFHELLYRVMRRIYGAHPLLLELDMQLFELITQQKVHALQTQSSKLESANLSSKVHPLGD